jgi:hypothetical protein
MRCMCGAILEIDGADDGLRSSCDVCRRRFDVHLTEDVATGQKGVSLHYLTDDNRRSGETSTFGAATTSFELPGAGPSAAPNGATPLPEPEQPDEALFRCPCTMLLLVPKALFEKRAQCPSCGGRMLIFLLWDAAIKTFTVQHFSLVDESSGQTRVLTKI